MSRKDTRLQKLSETIYIRVEELRGLGIEDLDKMFMEEYLMQADQLTDSRQQLKVRHSLKNVCNFQINLDNSADIPVVNQM